MPLQGVRWQTPVDLQPQYSGTRLLVHYGSPTITDANTVVVPVKTGAANGFRIDARDGANGGLKWSLSTDYLFPPHNWTPSYSPTITPGNRVYFPGAGGTVMYRDDVNAASGASGRIAFFGDAAYNANAGSFNSSVFINTPITSDNSGNIYFGYRTTATTPLGAAFTSGIARIAANGVGTWITAAAAAPNDPGIQRAVMNCAPAISADGSKVYIAVRTSGGTGDLVALNSATLAPIAATPLMDPLANARAGLSDNGTASPMIGPDGDVYFGVLELGGANHGRGFMLHFSGDLAVSETPGAFGWDDTASVVPASMVPSYHGGSPYLLMTKYNNYAGNGGDGVNKIAIVDPNDTQLDPIAGPTPAPDWLDPQHPNAVREWCINTAVVDPATKSILVNNEDGTLYRWDLATNALTQHIVFNNGIGEAYTPTIVGPDGAVYAINNAVLYNVGLVPEPRGIAMFVAAVGAIGCRSMRRS
jgi:hypothetical protein